MIDADALHCTEKSAASVLRLSWRLPRRTDEIHLTPFPEEAGLLTPETVVRHGVELSA